MSKWVFGERSEKELVGVKVPLVRVTRRALELSQVDFGVHDGMRTLAEQQEYVRRGVSQTLNSKHLTGDAVDLVPYVNGKLRWEWGPIYLIAVAVKLAAVEYGVQVRWGGVWDRTLNDLGANLEREVESYVERRRKAHRRAFIDGPHFELI